MAANEAAKLEPAKPRAQVTRGVGISGSEFESVSDEGKILYDLR